MYTSVAALNAEEAVSKLTNALVDIKKWMDGSRLKLNAEKTQLVWVGTRQQLEKVDIETVDILESNVQVSSSVKDLGVLIDNSLSMSGHVNALTKSSFFQLRQIRTIKRRLPRHARETLIRAFVSSKLDYCNVLLYNINDGLLKKLQRVQNAAARLIFDARKNDHATPLLRDLHRLPVRRRIDYKLCSLVYKCLHDAAPEYLSTCCIPVADIPGRRHLRSASRFMVTVPRTKTKVVRVHSVYLGLRNGTLYRSIFGIQNCRMTAFRRH